MVDIGQIIISDKEKFEKTKQKIKEGGLENLHLITDFERTLTKAFLEDGKKIPSIISLLRNYDYLSEEYSIKAKKLFNIYHPIEIDSTISEEERKDERMVGKTLRPFNKIWTK